LAWVISCKQFSQTAESMRSSKNQASAKSQWLRAKAKDETVVELEAMIA
jgi:hypothetical protein